MTPLAFILLGILLIGIVSIAGLGFVFAVQFFFAHLMGIRDKYNEEVKD